jgi:hypothetical protein
LEFRNPFFFIRTDVFHDEHDEVGSRENDANDGGTTAMQISLDCHWKRIPDRGVAKEPLESSSNT